jgi:hypothetical protein
MYSPDDPRCLWVSASDEALGNGTFGRPFGRIAAALSVAQPGQIVVLKAGTYNGDLTIQASGSFEKPLRIVAGAGARVTVLGACWYFYDVCDLIVSGLTFKDSPLGGIAVVGECERNRFENLSFLNCGYVEKASCTLFFGGSGGTCNIVEFCSFERQLPAQNRKKDPDLMTVGLMISEGDAHEGKPITDHVIRRNRFINYDYGILLGAEDAAPRQYGHLVSYNTIENCSNEGIMVKCGDTQVKGNVIARCPNNSISVVTGEGSIVEDNRIVDCGLGIRVAGKGHTVSNNCIIRCGNEAIRVMEKNGTWGMSTQNIIVEQNTLAGWSQNRPDPFLPGISIEQRTSSVIKRNLFLGSGQAYRVAGKHGARDGHLVADNVWAGAEAVPDGVIATWVDFAAEPIDNYDNLSAYGAHGWMCRPDPFDPDAELCEEAAFENAEPVSSGKDHGKDVSDEPDGGVLQKSLFFENQQPYDSLQDEPPSDSGDCDTIDEIHGPDS